MGCGNSKDHPKNADLVKLRKKYDTEPIKKAKLINVWVIGGNKSKGLSLAKLISEKQDYLLVTQDCILQTETDGGSERGTIIKEILEDKGTICPDVVLDLVTELILEKLNDTKGLVFHDIPKDKDQARQLQRIIGPVDLIVYCELKGDDLKAALTEEGDEIQLIKTKVENFQKCVLHLSKHKTTMKIDGTSEPENLIDEITEKIKTLHK